MTFGYLFLVKKSSILNAGDYIFRSMELSFLFCNIFSSFTSSLSVNSFIHSRSSSPLEHWNYLGVDENLGPVAVSLRREKLDEHKEHGQQYNYRVIFRTSEVH